jgi:hypothetical protein
MHSGYEATPRGREARYVSTLGVAVVAISPWTFILAPLAGTMITLLRHGPVG